MAKVKTTYPYKPEKHQGSEYIFFLNFFCSGILQKIRNRKLCLKITTNSRNSTKFQKNILDSKNNAESTKNIGMVKFTADHHRKIRTENKTRKKKPAQH